MNKKSLRQKVGIIRPLVTVATCVLSLVILATPVLAEQQASYGSSHCTTDDGKDGVWTSLSINGHHCIANGGSGITQNVIFLFLTSIIKFLTGGAGILAVGGVVWGGIMYATARGNSSQIQKAVVIILNALVALLLFFLLAALFNYLIPGGLFS